MVVTSEEGTNPVYHARDVGFVRELGPGRLADEDGRAWPVTDAALLREDDPATQRPRVPAHCAFWLGCMCSSRTPCWWADVPDPRPS